MEASYPPNTVAEDTASTPLQKVGRYHAVILTGQEARIIPRAVTVNFLDMASIRLAVGLVLLIAANIALGSINAIIACEWDLVKFRNGCIKGGVIALALIAVYFAGYLNPDLMVVEVSGQTVNLMTAVSLVMLAAFTAYAVDVIGKLKDMLLTATPGTDQTPAALPEKTDEDEAPDAPKEE